MSGHFESNAVSDVMSFNSCLSSPFLGTFFLAAVKHKEFGVRPSLKDLILYHRRLILRSNWTLARFQESYQRVDLRRLERAGERRHIASAVDDPDDNIISRQFVSDVGEIGPATTAMALDQMTTETRFVVKKLPAFKDRSARCADNFFGEGQGLKIWRPRRLLSRNPERADHDHRQ